MKYFPKPVCYECGAPDAKVVAFITKSSYCGKLCLKKGRLKYNRIIAVLAKKQG